MKDNKWYRASSTHEFNKLLHMIAFPYFHINGLYKDVSIQPITEVCKEWKPQAP